MHMPIDRYASPEILAEHSEAPLIICAMIFRAANNDPKLARDIRSTCMKPALLKLKRAVIYAARMTTGYSYRDIARAMNCDHSTALHSFRMASLLIERDRKFAGLCERIVG